MKLAWRIGSIIGVISLSVWGLTLIRSAVDDDQPRKLPVQNILEQQAPAPSPTLSLPQTSAPHDADPYSQAAYQALITKFNSGDFDAALALGEKHLRDAKLSKEYLSWLMQQMPALLNSSGWMRIQQGRYEDAIDYLQRSLVYRTTAEAHKGLALCFYKMKQVFDADNHWRSFALTSPPDSHMLLLHADILESIGDYEEASAALEEVKAKNDPSILSPEELSKKLRSMQAKAREAGHQTNIASEHFTLTYRVQDHDKLAPLCLDLLENAYEALRQEFGIGELRGNLEVFLYPEERFQTLVANSPAWAGGIFDGRLRLPISAEMISSNDPTPLLRKVVRHELSHAMLADQVDRRRLPPWFSEGFAQYVECTRGCGFKKFPMMKSNFLTVKNFEQDFISLDRAAAEKSYRQSLYLILVLEKPSADGLYPLRMIIDQLTRSSNLDSDSLLKPAQMTFEDLVTKASRFWNQNTLFTTGSSE